MYPPFVLAATRGAPGARRASLVPVDRAALGWILGQVERGGNTRPGLGVNLSSLADSVIDGIVARLGPTIGDWAQKAAVQAEPKIRQIAREEIAPKLGMYAAFAMLGAGIFSGLVGAFFASRGYTRVRPPTA